MADGRGRQAGRGGRECLSFTWYRQRFYSHRRICYSPTMIDHSGKRFHRWTVLRRIPIAGRKSNYRCVCDCGETRNVSGATLVAGTSRSCGCLQREVAAKIGRLRRRYTDRQAALRAVFCKYRWAAAKRGVVFSLTFNDTLVMFASACSYCGTPPDRPTSNTFTRGTKKGQIRWDRSIVYNGIDQVVAGAGYTPENTVACCYWCNRAKSHYPLKDFVQWLDRVAKHRR